MKLLPPQAELLDLLRYEPSTGKLYWRERDRSRFSADGPWKTWNNRYAGAEAFTAVDAKGYKVGAIFDTSYRAARVIYKMLHNVDAEQVDHDDGDRQNNRPSNLVDVSGQQNQRNMKRSKANSSGHTGVAWDPSRNRWVARIMVDRKNKVLGRFTDIADAVAARKAAEQQYGFNPNHGR